MTVVKLVPLTIEDFRKVAQRCGAKSFTEFKAGASNAPTFWCSDWQGDCGSQGCQCSPGIWVSAAFANGRGIIAQFASNLDGTPVERGDDPYWDEPERRNWKTLCELLGIR